MAAASDKRKTKEEVKQLILTHLSLFNSLSKGTKEETLNTKYACNTNTGFDTSCAVVKSVPLGQEKSKIYTLINQLEATMSIKAYAIPNSYEDDYFGAYDCIIQDSEESIVVRIGQAESISGTEKLLSVFIEIERTQVDGEDKVEFKIVGLTLPSEDADIYGPKHHQAVQLVRQFTKAFYAM